jgi:hypothetical protein
MNSHQLNSALLCISVAGALTCGLAWAQSKPLRIGMTLSDIPTTSGQPNGGFEGYRMTGYTSTMRSSTGS